MSKKLTSKERRLERRAERRANKGSENSHEAKVNRGNRMIQSDRTKECRARNLAPVVPKNQYQSENMFMLKNKQVVVSVAPAGTGKTFMAIAHAMDALMQGKISKITLTRPAVGMGNTIGLLKGDMVEKFTPYLMPMIQAINERYGKGVWESCLAKGSIEIVPFEYLRGRNIHGICIVDEAQNTVNDELLSLVTRVTENAQLIVLGDPMQTDIRGVNGIDWLVKFSERHDLGDLIGVCEGESDDIVRSGICKRVVKAAEFDLSVKHQSNEQRPLGTVISQR